MRVGGLAHKIFILLAFLAFFLAAIVAVHSGLAGKPAASKMQQGIAALSEYYQSNTALIETGLRALGVGATCLFGLLALLRAWHYAETSLPQRLAEFIERKVAEHARLRQDYISSVGTDSFDEILKPRPVRAWWHSIRWLNPVSQGTLASALVTIPTGIDSDIRTLKAKIDEYRHHKASVYTTEGLECLRNAGPTEQEARARDAFSLFKQAIDSRPDDLDALELAAKQARLLHGDVGEINGYLEKMGAVADRQKQLLPLARSRRFQAQLLFEQGKEGALGKARQTLDPTIDLISGNTSLPVEDRERELGRLHELRGHVQTRRERFVAAGNDLNEALRHYGNTSEPYRSEGLKRVAEIRKELDKLKGDKESEGD